jgi:hypothetical protein
VIPRIQWHTWGLKDPEGTRLRPDEALPGLGQVTPEGFSFIERRVFNPALATQTRLVIERQWTEG